VVLKSIVFTQFPAKFVQGERERMKKSIMVLDANKEQCRELCDLLEKGQFTAIPLFSTDNLEKSITDSECRAIFWDIDTVPADNRTVRIFTNKFPDVYFFCLSRQAIHPELRDAISQHIYACLSRPIDADELFFWLRSIDENESNSTKPATNQALNDQ
jgi:DNA-binding NtrC family response regulator